MNDIKMTNIPSMAVGKMVNQLSEAYSTVTVSYTHLTLPTT